MAECRATGLDGHGTGRHALVRRVSRVRGHDLHASSGHIEFLGDDGAERRENALPDIHLSGERDHAAFAGQANPTIQ